LPYGIIIALGARDRCRKPERLLVKHLTGIIFDKIKFVALKPATHVMKLVSALTLGNSIEITVFDKLRAESANLAFILFDFRVFIAGVRNALH
jgi:hypothetical protein